MTPARKRSAGLGADRGTHQQGDGYDEEQRCAVNASRARALAIAEAGRINAPATTTNVTAPSTASV
jgi:hypothetical protein